MKPCIYARTKLYFAKFLVLTMIEGIGLPLIRQSLDELHR